jgi:hypothetical protein
MRPWESVPTAPSRAGAAGRGSGFGGVHPLGRSATPATSDARVLSGSLPARHPAEGSRRSLVLPWYLTSRKLGSCWHPQGIKERFSFYGFCSSFVRLFEPTDDLAARAPHESFTFLL